MTFPYRNAITDEFYRFRGHENLVKDCIESIMKIIRNLYEAVKQLERIELPSRINSVYQPLDELNECPLFQKATTDFKSEDIKVVSRGLLHLQLFSKRSLSQDFLNIFLYFQSQCLTRLCLVLMFQRGDGFHYIQTELRSITSSINVQIDRMARPILEMGNNAKLKQKLELIRSSRINFALHSSDSASLAKLKNSSLDVTSRLLAVANESEHLNLEIQSLTDQVAQTNTTSTLLDAMQRIEQSIAGCQDDYQKLMLTYNKYFLQPPADPLSLPNSSDEEPQEEKLIRISAEDAEENSDYFAIRDSSDESDDNTLDSEVKRCDDDDLDAIDLKLSKKSFAPVLKQLKTKINPIKDAMKERERSYLKSKGIDPDKYDQQADHLDDLSDGSGDELQTQRKLRTAKRYDDQRSFLEQKQQFCLLPMVPPVLDSAFVNEDILE